jgi:predicted nucleic acid-binding protein
VIAIDTNVLFELLFDRPAAKPCMLTLSDALAAGPVVMCDPVVTELCARGDGAELVAAAHEMGVLYSAIEERSAIRAGEMLHRYRVNGGAHDRMAPDFLIGAHAHLQCNGLITMDHGFKRQYFKGLKIINPAEPAA